MTTYEIPSVLEVKKLSDNATIPTRGSPYSAGYDLSSAEHTLIKAGGKGIVKTDLSIACPEGTYARIAPRSGLAVKKFIDVGAGVVDADYRGPVGVILFNFGDEDFVVEKGDRVAQLILEKISMADTVEVADLSDTERGAGGFGSTGVKKQKTMSPAMKLATAENISSVLEVKKLSDNATIPTRGSPYSAGYDLSSAEHTLIKAGGKGIVKTDLSIACPEGTYARIAPRSGLAVKKFIDVGAGVVDADYRGPVGVILFNFGDEDFVVEKGDRVAQLILEKISMADTVEVADLSDTERGAGGFGSTGVKI
jgi:dUTP pyrophosphatase